MKQTFELWGALFDSVRSNAIKALSQLDQSKRWRITIEPKRKTRTIEQNATLFGVKYPPLMEFMGLRGEQDRQDLHEYFCGEYFGWKVVNVMGKQRHRPNRTTTTDENGKRNVLPWDQFWDFVEFVDQRAAEQGCVLPEPDPMYHHQPRNEI